MQTPKWLRTAVGLPGTVSFSAMETTVTNALSLQPELDALSSQELLDRAQAFAGTRSDALALAVAATRRTLGITPRGRPSRFDRCGRIGRDDAEGASQLG